MQIEQTAIPGVLILKPAIRTDPRGTFVKTFHQPTFRRLGLATEFAEQYYSSSRRGVLRGMHFQTPPHDHDKLVCCLEGEILDVALDLRRGSPTYGGHVIVELTGSNAYQLYIPKGMAHGFYVVSDDALMLYNVTTPYAPDHDTGVLWSSANIPWPDQAPLVSERDSQLPRFDAFVSPF
jgi:dTDP-4-dehydrorhamnose 3,5-epimerase